jgi:hypothetical protein
MSDKPTPDRPEVSPVSGKPSVQRVPQRVDRFVNASTPEERKRARASKVAAARAIGYVEPGHRTYSRTYLTQIARKIAREKMGRVDDNGNPVDDTV